MTYVATTVTPEPPPPTQPSLRAGETDGRFVDCTLDLGAAGDRFTTIGSITLTITRQNDIPVDSTDLQSAGSAYPDSLDSTGLIPTFGLTAPLTAARRSYKITLSALTQEGRTFVRDCYISVAPAMG